MSLFQKRYLCPLSSICQLGQLCILCGGHVISVPCRDNLKDFLILLVKNNFYPKRQKYLSKILSYCKLTNFTFT